jgi:hypothetical protein
VDKKFLEIREIHEFQEEKNSWIYMIFFRFGENHQIRENHGICGICGIRRIPGKIHRIP